VKRLAAKASLHRVYNNQIESPHDLFSYCGSNIHITFFHAQQEKILNKKKELSERFDIAVSVPVT
jgi:hypothetical protein